MNKFKLLCAAAAIIAPVAPVAVPAAYAQEITAAVEGDVTDQNGAPINGATIVLTDTRTGSSRTFTAGGDGRFSARGLTPGGPYTVTATAPGYQGQTVEGISTTLQGAVTLTFTLESETAAGGETIVVTAQRANVALRAIGPGQAFGEDVIEALPSFTNDIRDIIRIDPRVSLDRDLEVDRVSCLGANDRSNTFTVDGITQADIYGLNGTPFAARSSLPLPMGSIRQTSVEFAPFDVEYGQFTGCAINVVTRSGENQFHGSAFFTYTGDSLTGDSIDGQDFTPAPFDEYRWGATLGGPIFRDRLFFHFGYEETDTGDSQDQGPSGAGFANELRFIDEAQFNEISDVIRSTYGIDPGGIARTLPKTSRRFFGRVDFIINPDHRLEVTYQRLEESDIEPDDFSSTRVTGFNTFQNSGTISNYYSARLYSQWNDNLSTEIRASRAEVQDLQGPVGGGEAQDDPIPRIIVGVENDGQEGVFLAGPGFSRSANDLQTEVTQFKAKADLIAGAHTLTLGTEINHADVFNLFVQNATGTLQFANIDDLRAGLLACGTNTNPNGEQVLAGNDPVRCLIASGSDSVAAGAFGNFTPSGDINQAAADWKRAIYSVYAQDEWRPNDSLTVLAGIRIDMFSGDTPIHNPNFAARYGFSNAVGFSHLDPVILPRFAVTYDMNDFAIFRRTQIRGGVGIFSGGDPAVWFSNAFQNNGIGSGEGISTNALCNAVRDPVTGRIDVVTNGTFTGIPECIRIAGGLQAGRGLADTQSIDPNIVVPTVVRANLGIVTDLNFTGGDGFFDGWRLNLDYIYSHYRNPLNVVDLSQTPRIDRGLSGFTIDGRPIYAAIDPTVAGCDAVLQGTGGTPPVWTGVTAACFNTSRDDELQLTNSRHAYSHVASFSLSNRFDGGIFTEGGSTFVSLGYAYTDSNDRRIMGNSTATSNFDGTAYFDRQNPSLGTSVYETRHNISVALNFEEEFFGDYETQFGLVFIAREGRPYSVTFGGSGVLHDSQSGFDNALIYVPTGIGDPNIVYRDFVQNVGGVPTVIQTAAQVEASFNEYIDRFGCIRRFRGGTVGRNSCRNDWVYDLDLQFSQELPGPARLLGVDDRLKLIVNFDNFLNLIDDSWNVFRRRNFAGLVNIADLNSIDGQGRYVINRFNPDDANEIQTSSSLWRIQVGIRYEF
ncbi:MAG TPA: TonB-dependent receptor [Allosphingosinicella sp.]|nr:TonB-dependent receptor [Allosphingosinicella sp.]